MMKSLIFAACAAAVAASSAPPPNVGKIFYLTDAAKNQGAVCLDGSPAAYYYAPGIESTKFYIHQQGGGWCTSDDDCFGRSKTNLGSSKNYSQTLNFGGGYFSNDPVQNPLMWNFTRIYLPYCDGTSQTSDVADPVSVGSGTIYYRGHRILKAMIAELMTAVGLAQATDVVVSGCSAGGLATFLHADAWTAALPATTKVVALPDSGHFMDYNSSSMPYPYGASMRWVFNRGNGTGGVPAACVAANQDDPAKCIFAEHVSPHLVTPFFPLQSEYDSWQIGNDLHTPSNNNSGINSYGAYLTATVTKNLLSNPRNSIFLDSCYHHCGDEWNVIKINGDSQATAFSKWYASLGRPGDAAAPAATGNLRSKAASTQQTWIQGQVYPCTACCTGGGM